MRFIILLLLLNVCASGLPVRENKRIRTDLTPSRQNSSWRAEIEDLFRSVSAEFEEYRLRAEVEYRARQVSQPIRIKASHNEQLSQTLNSESAQLNIQ